MFIHLCEYLIYVTFSIADAFTKRMEPARIELAPRFDLFSDPSSLNSNSSSLFCSEMVRPHSFKAGAIILLKLFTALVTSKII